MAYSTDMLKSNLIKLEQINNLYRDYILSTSERYINYLRWNICTAKADQLVYVNNDDPLVMEMEMTRFHSIVNTLHTVEEIFNTDYSDLVVDTEHGVFNLDNRISNGMNKLTYVQGILYGYFPAHFFLDFEHLVFDHYENQVKEIKGSFYD